MQEKLKICRDYEDIMGLSRPVSKVHKPMSAAARAAQFSPFCALSGYEDVVRETDRITQQRMELEEDEKQEINEKLCMLQRILEEQGKMPEVSVTYFVPDERKSGGAYVTLPGRVKKMDVHRGFMVMQDGVEIPVEEISGITYR